MTNAPGINFSKILRIILTSFLSLFFLSTFIFSQSDKHMDEKTCFQTGQAFNPRFDIRSDIAIVYGVRGISDERVSNLKNNLFHSKDLLDRINSWKKEGYITQFMTGIAWGEYQNYFDGKYDGIKHDGDGQMDKDGKIIWHNQGVPYVVPTSSYINYFKSMIKTVIDCGITSIYLEEPEFWTKSGYSSSFKKLWREYYGSPWRPQDESAEAFYLSSKLKYHLFYNALKEVFTYAKTYGKSKGLNIKCYVPTHSLINYTAWGIVSPEASLASLPVMDGYIAQVWTGTARTPNYFNGVKKERVFENAFLEYGTMISMTAPTGRKIFLLSDPVEDRARSWDDYKKNYEATFTAELMYPTVNNYEVMPWPSRIYLGKFKLENSITPQPISNEYATQIQVMINSLNDMPLSKNKVSGSQGIGILLSNSLMFQRDPQYEDKELSNLYGIVMPILKRGIPLETVHMENLKYNPLKNIKVLIMTYSNMKPLSPDVHKYLARWVKNGGVLVYVGRDDDPFQNVAEWWNTNGNNFKTPLEHLLKLFDIKKNTNNSFYSFGKGKFFILRKNPKELVKSPDSDSSFVQLIKNCYENKAGAGKLIIKNNFYLERGYYIIASVMDETSDTSSLYIKGPLIDLFNPELPILSEKIIRPGHQCFLIDLNEITDKNTPKVLCAASRIYNQKIENKSYQFLTKSPSGTWDVMRVLLPSKPRELIINSIENKKINGTKNDWDENTKTLKLQFPNSSDGVRVKIHW